MYRLFIKVYEDFFPIKMYNDIDRNHELNVLFLFFSFFLLLLLSGTEQVMVKLTFCQLNKYSCIACSQASPYMIRL